MRFVLLALLFTSSLALAADPWSLKPVKRPDPPKLGAAGQKWAKTPIDQFIWAKLAEKKLTPNPPADARTLIRRVHFDLTGLPPTPEQIEAFAKSPTDAAYAKIVDELLASPHFGERWARHWLDVVRYGESDGFERNAPRPTAWHYRDWVIKALNADMPFDQFAKLQLAGDVLDPDGDGVKASGFLVAGIHNTVLGANAVARATARQDELEDIIAAVGQSFLGLTVQCARCHDHKFDPVDQTDYYRLTAALGGVTHGERTRVPAARVKLLAERDAVTAKLAALEATARGRVKADGKKPLPAPPLARWSFDTDAADSVGKLHGELKGGAKVANGRLVLDGKGAFVQTAPLATDLTEKTLEAWVLLPDLSTRGGGVVTVEVNSGAPFDAIVFGERQPKRWMAGSENFVRTKDLGADETVTDRPVHVAVVYAAGGGVTVYRDGERVGDTYTPAGSGLQTYKANGARVLLGLRHTGGANGFLRGEIDEARLYDKALSAAEVKASATAGPDALGVSTEAMLAEMTVAEKEQREKLLAERKALDAKVAAAAPEKVFAVLPAPVSAAHVLHRGSVEKPRKEVRPGGVECVPGTADFGLTAKATDADRRTKLAEWVARADNPLFTRVAVNRLWHHHFGLGIVDTPSDFGANGGKPSHPELLDWLASELLSPSPLEGEGLGVRGTLPPDSPSPLTPLPQGRGEPAPFSLKHLHRLIVLSAAYRQSSAKKADAAKIDADNRLLWRKSPVRLEAEAVRDAILDVSAQLDRTAGGPPFHDVKTYENNGTTYYQPLDAPGPQANRRTVYRFSPRGEANAVLETFDCPDPSAQTPRRQTTTTPLQALALWNDAFVLRAADKFAERVTADCQRGTTEEKVTRAYRLAIGREPTAEEAKPAAALVEKHGLKALGRVLFNCSEFVVVE
jgi:hypothetical protein